MYTPVVSQTCSNTADFPFVAELPRAEKKAVKSFWEQFDEMRAAIKEHGIMLPTGAVAKLLGVSRTRVYDLIENGTLLTYTFNGQKLVTEKSVVAWSVAEHKNGRPVQFNTSRRDVWRAAKAGASELCEK